MSEKRDAGAASEPSPPTPGSPADEEQDAQFAREVAELTASIGTPEGHHAWDGLQFVEEKWVRHILGIPMEGDLAQLVRRHVERGIALERAELALGHLAESEKWQWRVGSLSTGAGEGLMSMGTVRGLQTARAWLLAGIARQQVGSARALTIASAQALVREVERDSNGMGKRHRKSLLALHALLERASGLDA